MAHNLNVNKGQVSFASRKEIPWHNLGQIVDAMTSAEAIKLGGLDFEIEKRPELVLSNQVVPFEEAKNFPLMSREVIELEDKSKVSQYRPIITFPDRYVTVRKDNNVPLGNVGKKYHVIQNWEAFEFIDSIIGEGKADYETVGALGQGETIFITAKLSEEMVINKDLIDRYLLMTMSHDGSASIVVMFTPIRVVCNNTLSLALGGKNKVTIKHTLNAKSRLEDAKRVLGIVDHQSVLYKEAFGALATKTIFDKDADVIIERSLGFKRDSNGLLSTQATNMKRQALRYYQEGPGQPEIVGSAWGVFNAVTGYLQNSKEYKNNEVKFKNTFSGSGVEARDKAFNILINM